MYSTFDAKEVYIPISLFTGEELGCFFPWCISSGRVSCETMAFKKRDVQNNFKELNTFSAFSLMGCGALCSAKTSFRYCTAFMLDLNPGVCHCGLLYPFVTGPVSVTQMHVEKGCKQANISGQFPTWVTPQLYLWVSSYVLEGVLWENKKYYTMRLSFLFPNGTKILQASKRIGK